MNRFADVCPRNEDGAKQQLLIMLTKNTATEDDSGTKRNQVSGRF